MQVVVDTLLTTYTRSGTGKTVLLLHGWGDDSRTFALLGGYLSESYEVIALDLPGFGRSAAFDRPWTLDDYAAFTAAFLKKIGVENLHALVGHSNGGAIAIRGCALGYFAPRKLVLLSSAGIRTMQRGRKLALKFLSKTGKAVTLVLPETWRQRLRSKWYAAIGSDMLAVPHLRETFKNVVTQDIQADVQEITIPTLLIYGEQDTATPPQFGELFHELLPESTLVLMPGAGHFVHLDRPREVESAVEHFLR